jgi:uncharacterized protein with FMN-binding domain/DMSO/TMAO reductase YedYZ heme-binding membrane subunit
MDLLIILNTFLLSIILSGFIRKRFKALLVTSIIVSTLSYVAGAIDSSINSGYIGLGMFLTVMFTTAFNKRSFLFKQTMAIRKELSIIGFILIIPHSLIYLIGDYQSLEWAGIISTAIMIPLFFTSFKVIRKLFTREQWLNIQYFAYHSYILLFAHLMIVASPFNRYVYAGVLVAYIVLKLVNEPFNRINTMPKIVMIAMTLTISSLFMYSEISALDQVVADNSLDGDVVGSIGDVSVGDSLEGTYTDGVYQGSATGYKGRRVIVDVTIESDVITRIEIISCGCTAPRGVDYEAAVDTVAAEIVDTNSTDVDVISRATISTRALINAVNNALDNAK